MWVLFFTGGSNEIESAWREHLVPEGTQPLKWSGYPLLFFLFGVTSRQQHIKLSVKVFRRINTLFEINRDIMMKYQRNGYSFFIGVLVAGTFFLLGSFQANAESSGKVHSADVVIYGGTSAGVVAAVQAVRLGKTVILIESGVHLGGLTSGGLGYTDSGNKTVVGGIALAYYQRLKTIYDNPKTWKWEKAEEFKKYQPKKKAIWVFEPHLAEKVYEQLVAENNIPVYRNQRLDLNCGVTKKANQIIEIKMESGRRFRGKRFIDATYEGDLMAKAGVSYTVGREANSQYGETMNGVQKTRAISHQFVNPVSAYLVPGDRSSGLLPGVHGDDPGEDGTADHRIQAYCFRMCLSNHPENRVPFPKPKNYDPLRYELLARYLQTGWDGVFNKFDMIPNRKTDTNNHGAFSTDNIGMNYDYPEGDYKTRERIINEHRDYEQGFFWFLANDPRVPEKIQTRMNTWGLAKDEFLDNENWPHQLYVREARRMVSDFVMTENHLIRKLETDKPIGMGSYNMDSHNVQRYVTAEGFARNEGDIQVSPGGPYPVSYSAIVPREKECANLLVPVCLSSSHIAYGSIRMEPVFMILGQSAAAAACQSIDHQQAVQNIDYQLLKKQLLKDGQVLEYTGPYRKPRVGIAPKSLPGIVIDDTQAKLKGEWSRSSSSAIFVGPSYLHDANNSQGEKSVTYEFKVPQDGSYEVRISYAHNPNRASNVPVTIYYSDGTETKIVNQKKVPTIKKAFVSLGTYRFSKQTPGKVVINNKQTNGYVIADSVWIVPGEEQN